MTDLATEARGGPEVSPEKDAGTGPSEATGGERWFERRRTLVAGEILVSLVAALGFTLLCRHISVNPLNRIGQVSGLAKIQQYVAVVGMPILAVLMYTAYRGRRRVHGVVQRLACAALAGLSTGVVAGGVVVALHGTPWPLGGQEGDPSVLMHMATSILHGKGLPGVYPPGFPALIALWAKIRYGGVGGEGFALHDLQIFFSAVAGPLAYLAWRLLLRPFWALLIALPSVLLFLDPIRPYSHTTMLVLVPLLVAALRELHRAGRAPLRSLLLRGVGFGVVFGLLFLWYSGWYLWSAPGVAVLALCIFPWRRGREAVRHALAFLAVTVTVAAVVGAPLLYKLVQYGSDVPDRYGYIMTYTDPAYIMGWMSDRSGKLDLHTYPQAGELAGQSGYTILLLAAVGLGLGLGLRSLAVRAAVAILAGAWLMRFTLASQMAATKTIALYPRTTWIIVYCLMIIAVLGLMTAFHRGRGWLERVLKRDGAPEGTRVVSGRMLRQVAAGLVCVLALFGTMGASWSVNRYMPEDEKTGTMGIDAWRAHTIKKTDGTCPKYTPVKTCADPIIKDAAESSDTKKYIWCAGVSTEDWPAICGREAPWLEEERKAAEQKAATGQK